MNIKRGYSYLINSSTKNNGRKCIVLDFLEGDMVKIKFMDTGRVGKSKLKDLQEITTVSKEDKIIQLHRKKYEINMLIEKEQEEIKAINRRIENYKLDLLCCENELNNL
ncbi:hypothetical protein [Paenibacillus sp. USHLN196]|uniref:hypothetical protein n=1 Tax=Paenibacillus sp. USHLN196 TaxID=3081291 RepID=UPI00301931B7